MLGTLANIATLLGLLGTIMGLITAFAAVASADPAQKASLLSSSISVAMNTTALGLMTAIPLVFLHSLLQSRTASIIDAMEMVGMKLLNSLSQQQGWQDVQKA
ncbi:MAG: MotA/TolQ/ExbB proton channel family protein [Devosia sp.]